MAIKSFNSDPWLARDFVNFGYRLYAGDSRWIAPLRTEIEAQMAPDYPFYQKLGNDGCHFLAVAGRQVVGRASAMTNTDLKDQDGAPVGTIGFFECIEDYAVAQDLLDAAVQWLREERTIRRIWGPMNFDIWHGYRWMTRGFERPAFCGEPYNKPYYPAFFERYGFSCKQRWETAEVVGREALDKVAARGAPRYRDLVRQGYRFVPFDLRRFPDEVCKLYSLLHESFAGFIGFTPLAYAEFERLYAASRHALDPRFFVFVYDEMGKLAGCAGALLELSDAVRAMHGRDHWLARMRFLRRRRRVDRVLFWIGGVTPEEVCRHSGLGRAGLHHVVREIINAGFKSVLFALMARGNTVRGLFEKFSATAQREYALYELNP